MGKAIVYCGDCGRSLHEEDFKRGKAHLLGSGPYCVTCRPVTAFSGGGPPPPAARPASTTRIPKLSGTTRRAAAPHARGIPAGLLAGAALAILAVLVVLAASFSGDRDKPASPPPAPAVQAPPRPKVPPSESESERTEREMRAQRERDEATRLDRFLGDIRAFLADGPRLLSRRAEVEEMLSSAEKIAGPRRAEMEALRTECDRRFREAKLEECLSRVREMARDATTLLARRAEMEALLAEAGKEAGARRAEVDALRAECARIIEEAEKPWSAAIGFEEGFEKELLQAEDWKGLKYTEDPRNVHSGRRAIAIGPGGVGAGFWIKGGQEGRTYIMSCWVKRGLQEGEAWVGFEFFDDGKKRLTKHTFGFDSSSYKKHTVTVRAPAGTRKLLFWVWSNGKGEYFVDDVEVVLRPP